MIKCFLLLINQLICSAIYCCSVIHKSLHYWFGWIPCIPETHCCHVEPGWIEDNYKDFWVSDNIKMTMNETQILSIQRTISNMGGNATRVFHFGAVSYIFEPLIKVWTYLFDTVPITYYRVIFFTGTPPKSSKYKKVNLG